MKLLTIIIFFIGLVLYSCSSDQEKEAEPQQEYINNLYFVGMINSNPSLYKYNFISKKVDEFWSSKKEKVVELFFSEENNTAYFLTAKNHGKKGAFPFINNAKLYFIENDSSVSLIKEIGNGLQVFGRWDDENSFRIIFNFIDSTISNYINQQVFIFNSSGKILSEEIRTYNLLKDGYPLAQRNINLTSPQNNFSIDTLINSTTRILLKNPEDNGQNLIKVTNQKLKEVEWLINDSLVIISTIFLTPNNKTIFSANPQTSSLIIYSISKKAIETEWKGSGVRSFFIINNMLIFDEGFNKNSIINIYDFKRKKVVKSIRIKGGCGLKNIPLLPDFSA